MSTRYVPPPDAPRLKVINLWAGPGAGKSTLAAGLFNLMKNKGYSVELCVEWAKDAAYEDRTPILRGNQLYVMAKQDQRLRRLLGKSTYAITDSPLPLSLIYADKGGPWGEDWFRDAVLGTWRHYENINVIVERVKPYSTQGRLESATEAQVKDHQAYDLVKRLDPRPITVPGNAEGPAALLEHLETTNRIIAEV